MLVSHSGRRRSTGIESLSWNLDLTISAVEISARKQGSSSLVLVVLCLRHGLNHGGKSEQFSCLGCSNNTGEKLFGTAGGLKHDSTLCWNQCLYLHDPMTPKATPTSIFGSLVALLTQKVLVGVASEIYLLPCSQCGIAAFKISAEENALSMLAS
ncbi:hypothetical protein D5086_026616 [Populus alba]|uniref:Uncharacterized protein n=1 Tax=Populus alba TaxID=43335 RepID=A0ACC4B2C9_POPAL